MSANSLKYRPEIDGLRAVAVLAVIAFHAEFGLHGGYVGVDVFFTISGYLITLVIVRELREENFSLIRFLERRVRRLFPAAFLMTVTVMAAGWLLLPAPDYVDTAKAAFSQLTLSSNIYFWKTTDYFSGSAEEKPLLHTWSLAVEEQFYLLYPIFLVLLFKMASRRRMSPILWSLLVSSSASLFLCIWLLPRNDVAAFFLLPTRAWELFIGGVFALLSPIPSRSSKVRGALILFGLTGLSLPMFIYGSDTLFPGLSALPPCLGCGLVMWATYDEQAFVEDKRAPFIVQILQSRILVFIGKISYSLYLWHWPLFAFARYWSPDGFDGSSRVLILLATVVLSFLSWRFVETPFRRPGRYYSSKWVFVASGFATVVVLVIASVLIANDGVKSRYPPEAMTYIEAQEERRGVNRISEKTTLLDAQQGKFEVFGNPDKPAHVFVWGDSHARSILPGVDLLGKREQVAVISAWHSSTPPVLGYIPDGQFSLEELAPDYNQLILEYISLSEISHVLLVAKWNGYSSGDAEEVEDFFEKLELTIKAIAETGAHPWIFLQVPRHKGFVPKILLRSLLFEVEGEELIASREEHEEVSLPFRNLTNRWETAGATVLDATSLLRSSDGKRFAIEIEGKPLYYDDHHLTKFGAQFVSPALNEIFDSVSIESDSQREMNESDLGAKKTHE